MEEINQNRLPQDCMRASQNLDWAKGLRAAYVISEVLMMLFAHQVPEYNHLIFLEVFAIGLIGMIGAGINTFRRDIEFKLIADRYQNNN